MAQLKKETTIDKMSLLDYFYPIGTIYQTSDDSFSPSEHFGGEWTKIENAFLLGNGTRSVKDTGGEETHKLTTSEMPSHNHGWKGTNDGSSVSSNLGNYPFRIYQDKGANWIGTTSMINNAGGGEISQQYAALLHCCYLGKNFLKNVLLEFLRFLLFKKI